MAIGSHIGTVVALEGAAGSTGSNLEQPGQPNASNKIDDNAIGLACDGTTPNSKNGWEAASHAVAVVLTVGLTVVAATLLGVSLGGATSVGNHHYTDVSVELWAGVLLSPVGCLARYAFVGSSTLRQSTCR
jgi:hypothetical protein